MKLISLNLCMGKHYEGLIRFIKEKAGSVDRFCFQEMLRADNWFDGVERRSDLYNQIAMALPDYSGLFCARKSPFRLVPEFGDSVDYGTSIFVRKGIKIIKEEEIFLYLGEKEVTDGPFDVIPAKLMSVELQMPGGGVLTVCNFHGLWIRGLTYSDNEPRIHQAEMVKNYMEKISGQGILCGDFNLYPESDSMHIIEGAGLMNLIRKFGITSTRNRFYTADNPLTDCVMVTDGIDAGSLEVINNEISDHLPLEMEFTMG